MIGIRWSLLLTAIAVAALVVACGDGGPTTTTTTTTPPPPPAAVIGISGNGDIRVQPSLDTRFGAAIVFPVRIQETGGGTAIWNFFRVSYFQNGAEIERFEQGADPIAAAGYRDIAARANMTVNVVTRVNSTDWDDVRLTLGFIDNRDGRMFEGSLTLDAFDGVVIDLTPTLLPEGSSFAIVEGSR